MKYTVEWDGGIATFKSKGPAGIKRKIWMLAYAQITREDGAMFIWDGERLLAA